MIKTINDIEVLSEIQTTVLECFPKEFRARLCDITGEELFYVYKLMLYKPRSATRRSQSDLFFAVLKRRVILFLTGDQDRLGLPYLALAKQFRNDFLKHVQTHLQYENSILANKA